MISHALKRHNTYKKIFRIYIYIRVYCDRVFIRDSATCCVNSELIPLEKTRNYLHTVMGSNSNQYRRKEISQLKREKGTSSIIVWFDHSLQLILYQKFWMPHSRGAVARVDTDM